MDAKKLLLYGGGTIALGAVGFFVWSFFQKVEIPIGNTVIGLGTQTDTAPIKTPDNATPPFVNKNSNSTTQKPFDPNVNNPFKLLDDKVYSILDKFIHRGV